MKPLIRPQYKTQEVDSLYTDKSNEDFLMTNAEIVGTQHTSEGLSEVKSHFNIFQMM